MARQTVEHDTPDTKDDRLVAILEQLAANAPVQEIGYGHPKYQERLRAEGCFDDFSAPVFQNGREAQARGLKPETIERAPQLRPGKYLGGKVEVLRDNRDRVHLSYKSADVTDRMRFQSVVANFDDLIQKIWDEMHVAAA